MTRDAGGGGVEIIEDDGNLVDVELVAGDATGIPSVGAETLLEAETPVGAEMLGGGGIDSNWTIGVPNDTCDACESPVCPRTYEYVLATSASRHTPVRGFFKMRWPLGMNANLFNDGRKSAVVLLVRVDA